MILRIKNDRWLLVGFGVLALIAFLLFFRLGRPDVTSDDATYAFRAINLVDFMYSEKQTTPLQWFNPLPAWTALSFHDAPPAAFYIQHFFFKLFGVSTLVSRLPAALAGLMTAIFLCLVVNFKFGRRTAILSLLIVGSLTPFYWLQRLGYLESLMMPFLLASFYFFLRAQKEPTSYLWSGLTLGLALLTKYTALFLLPAYLAYLLLFNRTAFRQLKLWLAGLIMIVVVSPVIVYNFMMLQTRGHFDVQLAALFGQSNDDWPILTTAVKTDWLSASGSLLNGLADLVSWPVLIFWAASCLLLLWQVRLDHYRKFNSLILLATGCWLIFIMLTNTNNWFLATGYPWIVLSLVSSIVFIKESGAFGRVRPLALGSLAFVLLWSTFYAVNTNQLTKPVGQAGSFFSAARRASYGFNQIEDFLLKEFQGKKTGVAMSSKFDDSFDPKYLKAKIFDPDAIMAAQDEPSYTNLIVYDRNFNWFATLWYFRRFFFYGRYPVSSTEELALTRDAAPETFKILLSAVDNYYYFSATDDSLKETEKYQRANDQGIEQRLKEGATEVTSITDKLGRALVIIYEGKVKESAQN